MKISEVMIMKNLHINLSFFILRDVEHLGNMCLILSDHVGSVFLFLFSCKNESGSSIPLTNLCSSLLCHRTVREHWGKPPQPVS